MQKFIEVPLYHFRDVMRRLQNEGIKLIKSKNGNYTQYKNHYGEPVLRMYEHKKSEQCLVHVVLREYIPISHDINAKKEASIYA